jgi:hypothetical protein
MEIDNIRRRGVVTDRTDEEKAKIRRDYEEAVKTGRLLLKNRLKNRQDNNVSSPDSPVPVIPTEIERPSVVVDEEQTEQTPADGPIFKRGEDLHKDKVKKPWKTAKRFIQLPRIIIADKRLSKGAISMACILAMFDMGKKGKLGHRGYAVKEGIVFPSLTTLARAVGRSKPMVISYIKELHKASYLRKRQRYGKSNLYVMWLPVITSVEEIIKNYHVLSCPLTADDFVIQDKGVEKEVIRLFEIIKAVKDDRLHYQDKGKEPDYDGLEKYVLRE